MSSPADVALHNFKDPLKSSRNGAERITAIHPAGIERRWRDVATPRLFGTNKALLLHLEKKPFPANTPQPARDLLDVPCYTSNLQKILTFNLRAHQIPG
ncbi:hypothetical protein AGIG_G10485 [Arapaima gigas]